MKKLVFFMVGVLSLGILVGCAGKSKDRIVGMQKIVEKVPDKTPSWIMKTFEEKKKMMYFSGGVKGVGDYAVGLRQAKAEAVKNVAESIKVKARTEFVSNTRGANLSPDDLGRFIEDGVAMVTDNLEIGGMLPKENYYEKVEEVTDYGVKYTYNCFSLIQMAVRDYKEARRRAIENLADKAKAENNKKAEETAKDLLKRLTD